jgi:hypothetical protein
MLPGGVPLAVRLQAGRHTQTVTLGERRGMVVPRRVVLAC